MAYRNIKLPNLFLQKRAFINEYNDILLKRYNNNVKGLEEFENNNLSYEDNVFINNYYYNSYSKFQKFDKSKSKYNKYHDMIIDNIMINYKMNVGKMILKDSDFIIIDKNVYDVMTEFGVNHYWFTNHDDMMHFFKTITLTYNSFLMKDIAIALTSG